MDLIPGLPNDIALECLMRLPVEQFSKAASVSKKWKHEITLPEFRRHRKLSGLTRPVLAMVQAMVTTVKKPDGDIALSSTHVYRLSVFDPENGSWYDLPPIPELIEGLPRFCRVVGVGSDLVVIGGCDPDTWRVMDCVFIYNFISRSWRRGADMPGQQRLFFGCASDSENMILIAGGHDEEKNALNSVLSYDVVKDEWVTLPDMEMVRDECKVVFHKGKFHVIGGYPTWMQGHFEKHADVFDFATWKWHLEDDFMGAINISPHTCMEGDDGRLYMCRDGDVAVKDDATWQKLARLPDGINSVAHLTACQGKLILVGNGQFDALFSIYALNMCDGKLKKWTKLETPDEYCGHVQYGCCLEV